MKNIFKSVLFAAVAAMGLTAMAVSYESLLTVEGYQGQEPLENFPVLVKISESTVSGFRYEDCPDTASIRFAQDGKILPYEIEQWNPGGVSYVWVRLPTLANGKTFTLTYGGASVANTPSDVWAGNYTAVYHMTEASGDVADATGHGYTAVPAGSLKDTLSVRDDDGVVGAGRKNGNADGQYGSTTSYLQLSNTANLDPTDGRLTVSGWVRFAGTGGNYPRFMTSKKSGGANEGFEIFGEGTAGQWRMRGHDSKQQQNIKMGWEEGEWILLTFVYDGEQFAAYRNGQVAFNGKVAGGTIVKSPQLTTIGSHSDGSEKTIWGTLDEFRVRYGTAATADWVGAEYDSVMADGFLSIGAVQELAAQTIFASLEDVTVCADGKGHGPKLTVTTPSEGYVAEWSVDGGAYGETLPVEPGTYEVSCRLTADGFAELILSATVTIEPPEVVASAVGGKIVYDGARHGCTVTVTDPAEGYRLEWSTDGETFSDEQPVLNYGLTRVYCRVSKSGYTSKVVDAVMHVVAETSANGHAFDLTVAGYAGNALKNFPVLVRISETANPGFDYSLCGENGSGIKFFQNGILCPYEVEKWDPSGESLVWVRMVSLEENANLVFQFGGTPVANDPTQVWSETYAGVWHMTEASGDVADATGNERTAVPAGNLKDTLSVGVPGCIGSARRNGSGDGVIGKETSYFSLSNTANVAHGGVMSISGWVQFAGTGIQFPRFAANTTLGNTQGFEILGAGNESQWRMRGTATREMANIPQNWASNADWTHYVFVYDGDVFTAYENGRAIKSATVLNGAPQQVNLPISIASNSDGTEKAFYGTLDEFRLRLGVASSADWVKAEYECVQDGFWVSSVVRPIEVELLPITAEMADVTVFEDGEAHGTTVTVTEPGEGCALAWSTDGGATWGDDRPTFTVAGEYAVACRITADGYQEVTLHATVTINLREVVASAEYVQIVQDEQGHGCTVSIDEPADGYLIEWSTDGTAFSTERPVLGYGKTVVYCRISKTHYAPLVVSAPVYMTSDRPVYVAPGGSSTPVSPYATPDTAANDLLDAIQVAPAGGKVLVAAGEYDASKQKTEDQIVSVLPGVQIVGPDDCSAVFLGGKGEKTGWLHLATGAGLSGVTMKNFKTAVVSARESVISNCVFEGGQNCVSLGGEITHCTLQDFTGSSGVEIVEPDTRITQCVIKNGTMGDYGAVLSLTEGNAICLEDTTLSNIICSATMLDSSPVYAVSAPAIFSRCRFLNNTARAPIARLSTYQGNRQPLYATNCLFVANRSEYHPGGAVENQPYGAIWAWGEVVNCTFVDNDARELFYINSDNGFAQGKTMKVVNCIFQGNVLAGYEDIVDGKTDGSMRTVSYSIFPEATDENGNIVGPARFVGNGDDPYRLNAGSPGIGAGTNLNWQQSDVDLRGRSRLCGGKVDMGCYETGGGLAIFFF